MFVIHVEHIQCSKLFKGMEYSAAYGSVHYKEPLKLINKSRAYSRFRASFCRDIAMIVQKST